MPINSTTTFLENQKGRKKHAYMKYAHCSRYTLTLSYMKKCLGIYHRSDKILNIESTVMDKNLRNFLSELSVPKVIGHVIQKSILTQGGHAYSHPREASGVGSIQSLEIRKMKVRSQPVSGF